MRSARTNTAAPADTEDPMTRYSGLGKGKFISPDLRGCDDHESMDDPIPAVESEFVIFCTVTPCREAATVMLTVGTSGNSKKASPMRSSQRAAYYLPLKMQSSWRTICLA